MCACLRVCVDSLLQQVFAVRFLGSMAVRSGQTQEVIYEAMRQVLAARAIHNIFRTTESHLMVTSSCLRYSNRSNSRPMKVLTEFNLATVLLPAMLIHCYLFCYLYHRLIDPQTQVTRIGVRA